MTEFGAGAYINRGKHLHDQLQLRGDPLLIALNRGSPGWVTITGTPQAFVSGQGVIF